MSDPALLAVPAVQQAREELSRLASARSNYNIPRPPSEREADYERGVDAFAAAVCQARDAQLALEVKRDRAAVRLLREALRQAIKHGGKNAQMHVGDVLNLLDLIEAGKMDDKLDPSADSVTGPHLPVGIQ